MIDITKELENAQILLLTEARYYYNLLSLSRVEVTTGVSTLAVNVDQSGPVVYINPYLFKSIETTVERAECLKHELEHLLRRHRERETTREPEIFEAGKDLLDHLKKATKHNLFNIAQDRAINDFLPKLPKTIAILNNDGTPVIDPVTNLPARGTLITKQSFEELCPGQDINDKDAMEYYYSFIKDRAGNLVLGDGSVAMPLDSHERKSELPKPLEEHILNSIINEAYNTLSPKDRGDAPGHVKLLIEEINSSEKDWGEDIKIFQANSSSSYLQETRSRRNRRYGLRFPGTKVVYKNTLVTAIDSSASMGDKEIVAIWSQLHALHDIGVDIIVVVCDSEIHAVYKFDPNDMPNITGRGGTHFAPVFNLVNNEQFINDFGEVDGLIYFTDGGNSDISEIKEPDFPVLWALTPGCNVSYSWGSKTYIEVK